MLFHRLLAALPLLALTLPAPAQPSAQPPTPAQQQTLPPAFTPDPATIQRFGKGYRYPQEGWIVLHIEGAPYDRGIQHGRLMAPEIERYVRCYANMQTPSAPAEGWKTMRTLVNTNFLRGFDKEFLEEMQGIADGAAAAGARFDGRPIDLTDVAALNMWAELMSLDDANNASPTGLEGRDFAPHLPADQSHPDRCSAFAATGKATRDGHALIGHITMFDLYPSGFFNLWLDVKPDKGHRVLMQSYPAGIYSAMDYYLNDAGIAMVETTIDQTRFDPTGQPLASRARRALQYSDSIDAVVAALKDRNNGLYNNEWLLADFKTDEIAMYELATHAGKLWRSSKDEWWGGTPGFYWGCNNTKDLSVRLETIPSVNDRPANMVWNPADRDLKWVELYKANAGKMDEAFAKTAFTTPPLCSAGAIDVKFTSTALAKHLETCAIFGPPLGKTWLPSNDEIKKFADIRPLVSNPWTILGPGIDVPPDPQLSPVDLPDPASDHFTTADDDSKSPPQHPAWRGTILPASDADDWLASAFAEYQDMVSTERGYIASQPTRCLCEDDADKVASSLFAARSRYFSGVRAAGDTPLSQIHADVGSDAWYKIASGKGILVLSELRREMGDDAFLPMMDAFGKSHAGQKVTTASFISAAASAAKRDLTPFFNYWLNQTGLPTIILVSATAEPDTSAADHSTPFTVRGILQAKNGPLPSSIEMSTDAGDDEVSQLVTLKSDGSFEFKAPGPVRALTIDKYNRTARANGGQADLGSYWEDLPHTIIIYGTADDAAANLESAQTLQRSIRSGWANVELPIIADTAATQEQLASNHLILIGRPHANTITRRFAPALPVDFGQSSFTVRAETYANADSAVLAAGLNPLNPKLSINAIAGNSAAATLAHSNKRPGHDGPGTEVQIFSATGKTTTLVTPAPELTKTFAPKRTASGE